MRPCAGEQLEAGCWGPSSVRALLCITEVRRILQRLRAFVVDELPVRLLLLEVLFVAVLLDGHALRSGLAGGRGLALAFRRGQAAAQLSLLFVTAQVDGRQLLLALLPLQLSFFLLLLFLRHNERPQLQNPDFFAPALP